MATEARKKKKVPFVDKVVETVQNKKNATAIAKEGNPEEGTAAEEEGPESSSEFLHGIHDAFASASGDVTRGVKRGMNVAKKPIQKVLPKKTSRSTGSSAVDEKEDDNDEAEENVASVPPDEKLKEMNVVFTKRLTGVSIQDFYDIVWAEGNGTEHPPVYGPWLEASGKQDIEIQDWEIAEAGQEFVGDWCQEKYTHKRTATFRFERTTHTYMGPPIADVKHTHLCRVEDKDRLVLAMTIEMTGIPFADCFKVEVRWVATRVKEAKIKAQVGLFVNFSKEPMVASKIRAGTTEETTKSQLSLFEAAKSACLAVTGNVEEEEEKEVQVTEDETVCFKIFHRFFPSRRNDDIILSVRNAGARVKELEGLLQQTSETTETKTEIRKELVNLHASLDRLLDTVSSSTVN